MYIPEFWYRRPQSGQFCTTSHAKSMGKYWNASIVVKTHGISPNLSWSYYWWPFVVMKVQLFISALCKVVQGHQRPSAVFHQLCLIKWRQRRETSTNVFVLPIRVEWYPTWPISDMSWPWPEVKFSNWPFEVKLYIIRTGLMRKTMVPQSSL